MYAKYRESRIPLKFWISVQSRMENPGKKYFGSGNLFRAMQARGSKSVDRSRKPLAGVEDIGCPVVEAYPLDMMGSHLRGTTGRRPRSVLQKLASYRLLVHPRSPGRLIQERRCQTLMLIASAKEWVLKYRARYALVVSFVW